MNGLKLGLWVSCLALTAAIASCGAGNVGSPIQSDLNADQIQADAPAGDTDNALPAVQDDVLPAIELELDGGDPGDIPLDPEALLGAGAGEHGVSYTPGLPVMMPAGLSFPSILGYGWRGGIVTEGALAPSVSLTTAAGTPMAWVAYDYRELVAGRLQELKIGGAGQGLAAFMYNWNAGSWTYVGAFDLSSGIYTIPVSLDHATNGDTFLILVQYKPGTSTITKIRSNVF